MQKKDLHANTFAGYFRGLFLIKWMCMSKYTGDSHTWSFITIHFGSFHSRCFLGGGGRFYN